MADSIRAGASGTVPPDTRVGGTGPAASAAPAPDAVRESRITAGDLLRALLDHKVVLVAVCFWVYYPIYVGDSIPHDDWWRRMLLGNRWV